MNYGKLKDILTGEVNEFEVEPANDKVLDRAGTDDGNYHWLNQSTTPDDSSPYDRLVIVKDEDFQKAQKK